MAKIYEQGATDLIIGTIAAGSFGTSSKKITGLLEITLNITEPTAKVSADNDPGYLKLRGPAMGTGELKVTGIPIADYAVLTSALVGAENSVVAFGEQRAETEKGFSFKKLFYEDGVESINLIMVHKVVFGMPSEGAKSINEEGTEVTECIIPFEVYPAMYIDGTTAKRRTLTKLNSVKSETLYGTLKDKCFTPDEALLT